MCSFLFVQTEQEQKNSYSHGQENSYRHGQEKQFFYETCLYIRNEILVLDF